MFTIELSKEDIALLQQMLAGSTYQGLSVARRGQELYDRLEVAMRSQNWSAAEVVAFRENVQVTGT